ncbi:hypothetical protein [Chitiniphilus shinanonensis]|uniref:hypothetical protein n=1 Tax=Chitiniphilus shinanonensis TaxID=553088 RepID=UPI003068BCFF
MTSMPTPRPAARAELYAVASARYDAANIAHDYAGMVSAMMNIALKLQKESDPMLESALWIAGFIAEQAEHSSASEMDEARAGMDALQ